MSALTVSRREVKFRCDLATFERAYAPISMFMPADAYTTPQGYMVRSLYFDSMTNADYYDSVNGLELRKKIRLRIYSPQDETAKLELKKKQNMNQHKYSLTIPRADAEALIRGQYDVLLKYDDSVANGIHAVMTIGGYQPKVIVEYRRRAFVAEPNRIRVTFDSGVCACEGETRLFREKLPMRPVVPPSEGILEVKYNGFLYAYIKQLAERCDCIPSSNSKYVLSRSLY